MPYVHSVNIDGGVRVSNDFLIEVMLVESGPEGFEEFAAIRRFPVVRLDELIALLAETQWSILATADRFYNMPSSSLEPSEFADQLEKECQSNIDLWQGGADYRRKMLASAQAYADKVAPVVNLLRSLEVS